MRLRLCSRLARLLRHSFVEVPIPAGLTLAGKATLAVVVWACIMWITEAIPVGISGMLIPMLLVMSGAIDKFPKAASGFTTPVVFLCLAAFIFAAVMQAAGLRWRIALSLLHKMKVKTVERGDLGDVRRQPAAVADRSCRQCARGGATTSGETASLKCSATRRKNAPARKGHGS